ncbi:uncharacterized protein KD926_004615 [Aspergillus affinis]|uniref:uncharacterized protein n=1 Tax=Aspergillus affinis TaxID=1070780 RepID=UPI0022FE2BDE|nr:uncharacterized protein KD926_004615 [Aspergillus affinis]KAI9043112.1 hypothetical protein KD926_004615 [Aspergillus affinis]
MSQLPQSSSSGDEDWEIDLGTATKQDLNIYAINMQFTNTILDHNLWMTFREQFEGWKPEHFKQLSPYARVNLRNNLFQREIFVRRHNTRNPLYDILSEVVQQDEFYEWTDKELKAALEELDLPMITAMLRKRLNPTRDSLRENTQAIEGYSNHSASLKANPQVRRDYPDPSVFPEDRFATPKANPSTPGTNHVPETDYLTLETNRLAQESSYALSIRPKNDLSKEIASVTKIYTEDQKYSGTDNSSLDFKLNIFYDICSRAGLLLHGYKAALLTMLKGVAEDHYYSSGLSLKTFQEACHHLRQFFEGPEFYRQNLTKWNTISLQKIMNDNHKKSIY